MRILTHQIAIRPNMNAALYLPHDLTRSEALRLKRIIDVLVIPDAEEKPMSTYKPLTDDELAYIERDLGLLPPGYARLVEQARRANAVSKAHDDMWELTVTHEGPNAVQLEQRLAKALAAYRGETT